ncbi:prenyltransferase [Oceanospirillum sanctuarii]|uniref:prenyltransferase n=1 Tax=Oceanospirillum sanctuarii TaxID=1434821 RepID=UPI000A35F4EB|nr:prenyltransferase [Oceanospirillum sanctuarii]
MTARTLGSRHSNPEKYQLLKAARPFSLVVAVLSCLQGIILGWQESSAPFLFTTAILAGGIFLQFAVNLINDHSDIRELDQRFPNASESEKRAIAQSIDRNYQLGIVCFLIATVIGLFLITLRGLDLLWLCLIGLAGAYFYTQEPINYKNRGLGVPVVFFMMGILMIAGSSFVMTGDFRISDLLQAIPLSILTSLLLLSNEIRDFESDKAVGQNTLTVRIGYQSAIWLYRTMVLLAYLAVLGLWLFEVMPFTGLVLISVVALKAPLKLLTAAPNDRLMITPLTGRFHAVFGILLLLSYLLPFPI